MTVMRCWRRGKAVWGLVFCIWREESVCASSSMRLTANPPTLCMLSVLSVLCARGCSLVCMLHVYSTATNRVINASDHASIQLNIGHVDASGVYTGQYTSMSICGFLRQMVRVYKRERAQNFAHAHSLFCT